MGRTVSYTVVVVRDPIIDKQHTSHDGVKFTWKYNHDKFMKPTFHIMYKTTYNNCVMLFFSHSDWDKTWRKTARRIIVNFRIYR